MHVQSRPPGEVLREHIGTMPVSRHAEHLRDPRLRSPGCSTDRSGVSAEMTLRLSEALGTSPELWLKFADSVRPRAGLPRQAKENQPSRRVNWPWPGLLPY